MTEVEPLTDYERELLNRLREKLLRHNFAPTTLIDYALAKCLGELICEELSRP